MSDADGGVEYFTTLETHLLSEILYDHLYINSKQFEMLLKLGAIYIDSQRQTKDGWILSGSLLRIHTSPRRYKTDYDWNSLVIFENDFCLVLNKPSGIPSHPTADNALENALTQMGLTRKTTLFITHRLDTLTSGLIVYGKKQSFVKSFNIQLQKRLVKKNYVALIETISKIPNRLTHYMSPALGVPKKLSSSAQEGWALCELEILEQKEISTTTAWVKINLLTGRTHQIRAQLSHLHAPVVGDLLYGSKITATDNSICLRSQHLSFDCNGETLDFNLPDKFN